ncbi:hypothetical protein C804_05409 [Lachnospiraceae bacterium A4]|nr:hypothetical protein C804_05409 [Lachnospiraceae bacterium A4]
MGKITTKKRILFSFRGQVTINGQIMSEKPGIFCAQNGQKLWVFGQPGGRAMRIDKLKIEIIGMLIVAFYAVSYILTKLFNMQPQ